MLGKQKKNFFASKYLLRNQFKCGVKFNFCFSSFGKWHLCVRCIWELLSYFYLHAAFGYCCCYSTRFSLVYLCVKLKLVALLKGVCYAIPNSQTSKYSFILPSYILCALATCNYFPYVACRTTMWQNQWVNWMCVIKEKKKSNDY